MPSLPRSGPADGGAVDWDLIHQWLARFDGVVDRPALGAYRRYTVVAALEIIDRLAAARSVITAVLEGQLLPTPDLVDSLAELVSSAAVWSRRAAA